MLAKKKCVLGMVRRSVPLSYTALTGKTVSATDCVGASEYLSAECSSSALCISAIGIRVDIYGALLVMGLVPVEYAALQSAPFHLSLKPL